MRLLSFSVVVYTACFWLHGNPIGCTFGYRHIPRVKSGMKLSENNRKAQQDEEGGNGLVISERPLSRGGQALFEVVVDDVTSKTPKRIGSQPPAIGIIALPKEPFYSDVRFNQLLCPIWVWSGDKLVERRFDTESSELKDVRVAHSHTSLMKIDKKSRLGVHVDSKGTLTFLMNGEPQGSLLDVYNEEKGSDLYAAVYHCGRIVETTIVKSGQNSVITFVLLLL